MNKRSISKLVLFFFLIHFFLSNAFAIEEKKVEKPLTLPEIIVKDPKKSIKKPDALSVPFQTVTKQQIDDIGANSLADIMDITLGLDLVTSPDQTISPGVQTVRMRGMEINHTLILVDGVRLPGAFPTMKGYLFADIGTINIDTIERIEISKEGPSSKYGSDAIAGVVNIITKRQMENTTGKIQYGMSARGDGNETNTEISGGFSHDNTYYNLAAFYTNIEHYYRGIKKPWDFPDIEKYGLSGNIAYDIADDKMLDLVWRYSEHSNEMQAIGNDFRKTDNKNFNTGINFKGEIKKFSYDFGAFFTYFDTTYDFIGEASDTSYGSTKSIFFEYHSFFNYKISSKLNFESGFLYYDQSIDSMIRIDKSRKTNAFFSKLEISFDKLAFNISQRFENSNDFGDKFSSKFTSCYDINSSISIRASVAQSYQRPTLAQLYDNYIGIAAGGALNIYGNKALKASEGVSCNYGAVWRLNNRYNTKISLDYFYNRIDDMIDIDNIDDDKFINFTYTNLKGTSKFKGVECNFLTELKSNLILDLKASYLEATDPDKYDLTNRPQSTIIGILFYNSPADNFWGNIRYNYRGRYVDDSNKRILHFDYLSCQFNYRINDTIYIYLGSRNLLDEKSPVDFERKKGKAHLAGALDSSMGAFYYTGLKYQF